MRARNWAESENQRDQSRPGRDPVGQQSDGYIALGQALAHNAGPDDEARSGAVPRASAVTRRASVMLQVCWRA